MLAGGMYDPNDKQLLAERLRTRLMIKALNDCAEDKVVERNTLLKQLVPNGGNGLYIQTPFYCDYGYNIITGENVFFNFNCVILDVTYVTIGNRCMFGPNVQIYTATHPLNHIERSAGREFSKPITLGDDVWVGGSVVICPGVTIGDRSVIGAGSVVTKDIPADVFAAGNPCKVIRAIEP